MQCIVSMMWVRLVRYKGPSFSFARNLFDGCFEKRFKMCFFFVTTAIEVSIRRVLESLQSFRTKRVLNNLIKRWNRLWKPVVAQAKCDCKRNWLWVRFPHEEMKYLFKFISPFLDWCRGKALRWVSSLNPQCLQNSAKMGYGECLNTRPTLLDIA